MVDDIDKQIIHLLGQDARYSSDYLAKQVKLSSASVRRRVRKLLKSKILRFVGVVDPVELGIPILAVIALDIDHAETESIIESIAQLSEIRFVSTILGRYDIIAIGRFRSNEHLSEVINKNISLLKGVRNVETFLSLNVKKGRYVPD
jgi:Lrp/AsnC family transcriptional regulator for asnA, asnC and gidA